MAFAFQSVRLAVRRLLTTGLDYFGVAVCWLVFVMSPACASPGDVQVTDFQVSTWTDKDGVPDRIYALAQREDGWLWLGGPSGLYRFDGIKLEEVKAGGSGGKSLSVSALFAPATGELIVGTVSGAISILKDGRFATFDDELMARAGRIHELAKTSDSKIWATAQNGLLRFDGKKWSFVGREQGYPGGLGFGLCVDSQGTLWVAGGAQLLSLKQGDHSFEPSGIETSDYTEFLPSPDGRIWRTDGLTLELLPGQNPAAGRISSWSSRESRSQFFDAHGNYWQLAGPKEEAPPFSPSVLGIQSRLKSTSSGLTDRDGNLWIGSSIAELHRVRLPTIHKVPAIAAGPLSLVTDSFGKVWISQMFVRGRGLWMVDTEPRRVTNPPPIDVMSAMAAGTNGEVWFAGREGIWRGRGGHFEPFAELPAGVRGQRVSDIAADCAGGVWALVPSSGLLLHDGQTWRTSDVLEGLPLDIPTVMACDRSANQLWLGYSDGKVAHVHDGRATVMTSRDGLETGAVTAIVAERSRVFVGGERGIATMRAERFVMLRSTESLHLVRASTLLMTATGDLWISNQRGIARVSNVDLKTLDESDIPVELPVEVFDVTDGFPGSGPSVRYGGGTAALAADGKIWLFGVTGVAWLDSSVPRQSRSARPVFIQALSVEDTRFEHVEDAKLPAGTRSFRLDYTALDYTHPERVRFRYQLIGVDRDWVEAGTRRQAFYTNLGPGNYQFEVNASSDDGKWSDSRATVRFSIQPTFTQSRIFSAMCVVATLGLITLAYRVRIRQLTSRERLQAQAQVRERVRIARELHDTLLQGTQALIVQVDAAAKLSRRGEACHVILESALERADRIMVDGRDRIHNLRLAEVADDGIPAQLSTWVEESLHPDKPTVRIEVEGAPRKLNGDVRRESILIGQEALLNAFRHARAGSIDVRLVYSANAFQLCVSDDGVGIDEETLLAGGVPGHWGVEGMKERARGIGARLCVKRRAGGGTEVELLAPASVAYSGFNGRRWWRAARTDE